MRLPSGERFEWVKPIMLSGGRVKNHGYGSKLGTPIIGWLILN